MKKICKIVLMLVVLLPFRAAGQIALITDQYVLNPYLINPAFAGSSNALSLSTFYRQQWVGIEGAPETFTATIDAPVLNRKLGLGFMIVNDNIGVTEETQFLSSYAFRIKIKEGILGFGLGGGVKLTNTNWSQLTALDPGDDFYMIDSRLFVIPTFNFGLSYINKGYFASLSVPQFLSYKFDFNKDRYTMRNDPSLYTYTLHTGYSFDLNRNLRAFPSLLIAYSPDEKLVYDVNAYLEIKEKVWVGFSYRNQRSINGLVQFKLNNSFKLAYSYDIDLGKLSRYSAGSHGVMLRYDMQYKVEAVNPLVF